MSRTNCRGEHVCEPPDWPGSLEDTWACPECHQRYIAARLADEPSLRHIRGYLPDTLGWRSQAVTAES